MVYGEIALWIEHYGSGIEGYLNDYSAVWGSGIVQGPEHYDIVG